MLVVDGNGGDGDSQRPKKGGLFFFTGVVGLTTLKIERTKRTNEQTNNQSPGQTRRDETKPAIGVLSSGSPRVSWQRSV